MRKSSVIGFALGLFLLGSGMSANATSILVSQGVSTGYGSAGWTNMTSALNVASGFNVGITANFTNYSQLLNYEALWLDLRARDLSGVGTATLNSTEIANLQNYIGLGRRVVMIGEWGCLSGPPATCFPFAKAWDESILSVVGGTFGGTQPDQTVNPVAAFSHPLTTGVNQLYTVGNSHGIAIGGTALFNPNLATLWGGGNVLTILDESVCGDNTWPRNDGSEQESVRGSYFMRLSEECEERAFRSSTRPCAEP